MYREYSFWDERNRTLTRGFFADQEKLAIARDILREIFPDSTDIHPSSEQFDKRGIDVWLLRLNKEPLAIDIKWRTEDFSKKGGMRDLALEVWSVIDKVPGWTVDPAKKSHYILWIWEDTKRWYFTPFRELCLATRVNMPEWWSRFPHAIQRTTEGWKSECIFVLEDVVDEAIKEQIALRKKVNGQFTASSSRQRFS